MTQTFSTRDPGVGEQGHATILAVGNSNDIPHQGAVAIKLRLRVELPGRQTYECTTPWEVQAGARGQVRAGARVPVTVHPARLEGVAPLVWWARYSVLYSGVWSSPPRPVTAEDGAERDGVELAA